MIANSFRLGFLKKIGFKIIMRTTAFLLLYCNAERPPWAISPPDPPSYHFPERRVPFGNFTTDQVSVRDMSPPRWCNVFHGNQSACEKAYIRRDPLIYEYCIFENDLCFKSDMLIHCASLDAPSNAPPESFPPLTPALSASDIPWENCTNQDLKGDFSHNGLTTLGDAVWIASARLQYGTTGLNPVRCMNGDFDQDGYFTLNDAAFVAEVIFSKNYFPWFNHSMQSGI